MAEFVHVHSAFARPVAANIHGDSRVRGEAGGWRVWPASVGVAASVGGREVGDSVGAEVADKGSGVSAGGTVSVGAGVVQAVKSSKAIRAKSLMAAAADLGIFILEFGLPNYILKTGRHRNQ